MGRRRPHLHHRRRQGRCCGLPDAQPAVHRVERAVPLLPAVVLAAAASTGARLVRMENVYMYGRPAGQVLPEDCSYDAHDKGSATGTDGP